MRACKDKTIVILQSNYIPWKGYFDLMAAADEFLIFDEVQYTRRDWRNRNKIIVAGKPQWLTIPVKSKGKYDAPINQIEVCDSRWVRSHWETIRNSYSRAAHFEPIAQALHKAYAEAAELTLLTDINELFLRMLARLLKIETPILRSVIVPRTTSDQTERLIEICKARSATCYLSGPAAKEYIQRERFEADGVELRYANYSGYPVYDQGTESFEHGVSIVDTLMRCGPAARTHLKSVQNRSSFVELA